MPSFGSIGCPRKVVVLPVAISCLLLKRLKMDITAAGWDSHASLSGWHFDDHIPARDGLGSPSLQSAHSGRSKHSGLNLDQFLW